MLLCIALAGFGPIDASAQQPASPATPGEKRAAELTPVERPPEDELVLQVRLGNLVLSDGMLGILNNGGVLLPLGDLTRALDLVIEVDPAAGQAEGWFLRENRRIFLDLAQGEVTVEGRKMPIPRGLVELHREDIYVDSTLLSQWFPIDIAFDISELLIKLESREPFPIEERLAREGQYNRLSGGSGERQRFPRVDTPYSAIDWPSMDISSAFSVGEDAAGEETRSAGYSLLIAGDLLYMNMNLFVGGDDVENPSDARITLSRKDPYGELLGPLHLTEVLLGDVFTPRLTVVSNSRAGRGFVISTFPLGQPTEFDRTTVRGELPLGWQVELYRNEALLEARRSRPDGQFEFDRVPLLFGLNVLRLRFYGPQGQRREEVRRFFVGPGLIPPGEHSFRLSINEHDVDAISLNEDSQATAADLRGLERAVLEYEGSVTRSLSLAANAARIPLSDGYHDYTGLGVRAAVLGAFWRIDAVQDVTPEEELDAPTETQTDPTTPPPQRTAYQASVQTSLAGINLLLEHAQFNEFVSEQVPASADSLETRSQLRVDFNIPEWLLPRIPFSLVYELDRRESGGTEANITNRLSMYVAGVSASNTLSHRITEGGEAEKFSSADGGLLLSSRIGRSTVRGQLNYTVQPESDTTSFELTTEYTFNDGVTGRLSVNRQLTGDRIITATGGVFSAFRTFHLGVESTLVEGGTYAVGLTLSTGFGREPRTGEWHMRPVMASEGAASAQVFLDRNQNDRFDEGDEPLPGVKFNRQQEIETNDAGIAFLPALGSYTLTDVELNSETLQDPFWSPTRPGVEIVPRPGTAAVLDFPVVPTGEIDGTVYLRGEKGAEPASNVRIQLVDPDGKVVKEVRSEYDGFYLFDFVPFAHYTVRIAPDQVEHLKFKPPRAHEVDIVTEEEPVSGVDFTLERSAN